MAKQTIFKFLEALNQNNSKEWMDKNRSWYNEAKDEVVQIFDPVLEELKLLDPRIVQETARKSINRINNNLMFHPDRPTYKDHFGVGFGYGKGLADFYIHLGIHEQLIAGGLWHPPSDKLKKLRMEIDYEGERLAAILTDDRFASKFELYQEDKLKGTPKGYSSDHEYIDLLRMKSLAAFWNISKKDILSNGFGDMVIEAYQGILPLLDFVNTAITEE